MKIDIVNLSFTVRPPGGGVTTTSYTSKDYLLDEHERGVAVRHRMAPGKMLLLPWANICGIQYTDAVDAPVKPVQPPPRDDPQPDGAGGRFRKAG